MPSPPPREPLAAIVVSVREQVKAQARLPFPRVTVLDSRRVLRLLDAVEAGARLYDAIDERATADGRRAALAAWEEVAR